MMILALTALAGIALYVFTASVILIALIGLAGGLAATVALFRWLMR